MSKFVYPAEKSFPGTFKGFDTREAREFQFAEAFKLRQPQPSFVISGFAISNPSQPVARFSPGMVCIDGYIVGESASDSDISLPNGTNFVYLTIDFVNGVADDWHLQSNQTGTVPANSVCIGRVIASGGNVTSWNEVVRNPFPGLSSYTGDGSASRLIFLGFTPKLVILQGSFLTAPSTHANGIALSPASAGAAGTKLTAGGVLVFPTTIYERPDLAGLGFTVGHNGSSNPSLNESSITYRFIVF